MKLGLKRNRTTELPNKPDPVVLAGRRMFAVAELKDDYSGKVRQQKSVVTTIEAANLITSATENEDVHLPVFDLDFPAMLLPSSTKGHWHLYFDAAMSWENYQKLLDVMDEIGLLQTGWVEQSKIEKCTSVRKPGVWKPTVDEATEKESLTRLALMLASTHDMVDEDTAAKMRALVD